MRYYKQLVIHVGISSAVLILITAILTGIQVNNSNNTLVSILNNIIICFLTGGIILFFQAIIGYKNAKRECLLAYYKDLILLEDKIIHYPFSGIGFIEASKGLKDIRDITTLFDAGAKFTYMQIDFGERKDCVLEAAQMLFKSYAKHIKAYKEFDSDICDALRDAETSSQTEIEQINKKLQAIRLLSPICSRILNLFFTTDLRLLPANTSKVNMLKWMIFLRSLTTISLMQLSSISFRTDM